MESWLCTLSPLQAVIGDPPQRAAALLVGTDDGLVVGVELFEGDSISDAHLLGALERVVDAPLVGPPRRPDRYVVGSEVFSRRLAALVETPVVVGDIESLDALLESLQDHMSKFGDDDQWLADFEPSALVAMAEAAAVLDGAEPWDWIPPDVPLSVSSPALALDRAPVTVMGHGGETFGFMVFLSRADLDLFTYLGECAPHMQEMPSLPKCYGFSIDVEDERHGVPDLRVFEDTCQRPATPSECRMLCAVAHAVTRLVARHGHKLERAAEGGPAVAGRYTVPTPDGDKVAVRIRMPAN